MADVKNSSILARVLENAKTAGSLKDTTVTAERFMLALFDEIDQNNNIEEITASFSLLTAQGIDPGDARAAMNSYLEEDAQLIADSIYLERKLSEAREMAEREGSGELTADALLSCILKDPSAPIKKLINGKVGDAPAAPIAPVEPILPAEPKESADALSEEARREQERQARIIAEIEAARAAIAGKQEEEDDEEDEEDEEVIPPSPVLPADSASKEVKAQMGTLVSDMKRIRSELKSHIFGQDKAIDIFVSGFFQANLLSMIDKSRVRPRATFLFAGPPGVGKTFLAQKSAEALKLPFARFDMSEYCDKEAALEFCGSDAVYKNSKGGNFTTWLKKNPHSIILLDEIEKAHISIIHLFLQILDAGRIRDSKTDEELSLKDTILIFTTNAGKQLYNAGDDRDLSGLSRKVIIDALEKDVNPETGVPYFPSAICSRFASGNVVMFNHIAAHDLRTLAEKEICRQADNLRKEIGIDMELDERVYTALLLSEGVKADARATKSRAEAFFNDELYELFRLISTDKVESGIETIERISVRVDLEKSSPEIVELFESGEKKNVLVVASEALTALCRVKAADFEFFGAQSCREAIDAVQSKNIDVILLDMQFGTAGADRISLNIEDIESPAREFFGFLREQKSEIPVYLVEEGSKLHEEEIISFTRQGVRGMLSVSESGDEFALRLDEIASILHQQASMLKLAKENKLLSFETAQTVSADGKLAEIKLFDFKMIVAVDSEDLKNVLSSVSKPNVRFDDVIGAKDAKQELTYFVEYLKNPKKYMGTGVKAPKGVLLYGPPGTGKTMLAKAMAKEAGVTFIAAEGNQFLKRYIGEGSEKVHELFRTARKYAPSILFIDEIDAIARERRGGGDGGSSEVEGTLTAFLAEMDGFVSDPGKPVFVLAATNFDVEPGRPKSLDPALMRRFDRRVHIDLPDQEERTRYLKMKIARRSALEISEAMVENLAMRSVGMSLAQLDSVVELALRSAIRKGSTKVTDGILEEAFELFNFGETKQWDASYLERTARHEAGHALLCWLSGETPSYITIVARGDHGGYVQHAGNESKGNYTKQELLARIRASLGGRAAELVYYGEQDGLTTGAGSDLANATGLARQIVCSYGMDEEFGMAVVPGGTADGMMSVEVREVVNRILAEQLEEAKRQISENKAKIDALVEVLKMKNHLNGPDIDKVLGGA